MSLARLAHSRVAGFAIFSAVLAMALALAPLYGLAGSDALLRETGVIP